MWGCKANPESTRFSCRIDLCSSVFMLDFISKVTMIRELKYLAADRVCIKWCKWQGDNEKKQGVQSLCL